MSGMHCRRHERDEVHTVTAAGETYCVFCLWERTRGRAAKHQSMHRFDISDIAWASSWGTIRASDLLTTSSKNTDVLNHVRRVVTADLSYPVIITCEGAILDGCHRIVAAHMERRLTIPAVIATAEDLEYARLAQ